MSASPVSAGNAEAAAPAPNTPINAILRIVALATVAGAAAFLLNNYLIFWRNWPGLPALFGHLGWFGIEAPRAPLTGSAAALGWIQVLIYAVCIAAAILVVSRTRTRTLVAESESLTALAAFIVRGAFWAVLLVGLADMLISFLRVEDLLSVLVGEDLAQELGRSRYRGNTVHYPLIALSFLIAFFIRGPGFVWLALLIVVAELQIVIARFVFSYEQAFMADLVRFWYAALFLFASAYTLVAQGHVRVDILYAGFSERGKAYTNFFGSLVLGIPLCWLILIRGMWSKTNVINGPLLNFEVTQSGFGMYVKYLMAGFLVIYALSMLIQFVSYCLSSAAVLLREPHPEPVPGDEGSGVQAG